MEFLMRSTPHNFITIVSVVNKYFSVQMQRFFVMSLPITKQHMTRKTHVISLTFSLRKWGRRRTSILQ